MDIQAKRYRAGSERERHCVRFGLTKMSRSIYICMQIGSSAVEQNDILKVRAGREGRILGLVLRFKLLYSLVSTMFPSSIGHIVIGNGGHMYGHTCAPYRH